MTDYTTPPKDADGELLASICENLDEWNLLPGTTHEGECGFWGTEDGDGLEFCDCSHKTEVEAWLKCLPELQVLVQSRTAKAMLEARLDELNVLEANSDCLEDQCGLDAELLRDNLLDRIRVLEGELKRQQGPTNAK